MDRIDSPNILLALSRYDHRTHRGVAKFAAQHGWHLNCEMAITGRIPSNWTGDGIVAMLGENDELTNMVTASGCPFVDLSILRDDIAAPRIVADNHSIGRTAAEYFIQRGFIHFGFFSTTNDKVALARRDAFFQFIGTKCKSSSDLLFGSSNELPFADASSDQRMVDWLDSLTFPAAIFTTRDLDASIILDVCLKHDIAVPEQVAILGVDNNELIIESVRVPLSSVNHNVERLGYEGAQLLARVLNNEPLSSNTTLIPPNGITSRRSTDYLAVNNNLVRKALARMTSQCDDPLFSLDKLATDLDITRRYLDKVYRQELGHSCQSELQSMRILRAKKLLMHGHLSMEQISKRCGFNTPQYFNLCVKKSTGMTPLAFRRYHKTQK